MNTHPTYPDGEPVLIGHQVIHPELGEGAVCGVGSGEITFLISGGGMKYLAYDKHRLTRDTHITLELGTIRLTAEDVAELAEMGEWTEPALGPKAVLNVAIRGARRHLGRTV